jgi:hypothetical protein
VKKVPEKMSRSAHDKSNSMGLIARTQSIPLAHRTTPFARNAAGEVEDFANLGSMTASEQRT